MTTSARQGLVADSYERKDAYDMMGGVRDFFFSSFSEFLCARSGACSTLFCLVSLLLWSWHIANFSCFGLVYGRGIGWLIRGGGGETSSCMSAGPSRERAAD
jgi:hypothetical protein